MPEEITKFHDNKWEAFCYRLEGKLISERLEALKTWPNKEQVESYKQMLRRWGHAC